MFLDFEQPIIDLEDKIRALKLLNNSQDLKIQDEIKRLEKIAFNNLCEIYKKLTPWQKVMISRHQDRPHTIDYINGITTSFIPLAGDRLFGEDKAIIGGIGKFNEKSVVIIGHEKGSDTDTRINHNFGMAHPEGYRKVIRLLGLADKFRLPVIMFIDTPGAYSGTKAEERGQFEAIAKCIEQSLRVQVPIISIVIGEGGSGGAIAMAVANKVMMLSNSIYSVISPEGCASILWRTVDKKEEAAEVLKLTADDLLKYGIIDKIILEPAGGAHRNKLAVINEVKNAIHESLLELSNNNNFIEDRRKKFLSIGRNL